MGILDRKESEISSNLQTRFEEALDSLISINEDSRILVAYSGGSDSTALLKLFSKVSKEIGCSLTAAHLDHGIRGDAAEKDRRFAEKFCEKLGIDFIWEKTDCPAQAREKSMSLEEAARFARYDFLNRVREKLNSDFIATGHTADDNIEVVLFNLMRGAGPSGLAGIPCVRDGRIIRPVLGFWRRELTQYLKSTDTPWVEDASNQDTSFTRNRIRHELIPLMADQYNPDVALALDRTARLIRDEEDYWEAHLEKIKQQVSWAGAENTVSMDSARLSRLHPALGRRLVRAAYLYLKGHTLSLTFHHVEDVLALLSGASGKGIDLPGGIRAVFKDGLISFGSGKKKQPFPAYEYQLDIPGSIMINETGIKVEAAIIDSKDLDLKNMTPDQAAMDINRLTLPLIVRSVSPGDRFQPLGMQGTKKLKDFFIDVKLPEALRPQIPLITDKDGIIWVGGMRLSEKASITNETESVLLVNIIRPGSEVF